MEPNAEEIIVACGPDDEEDGEVYAGDTHGLQLSSQKTPATSGRSTSFVKTNDRRDQQRPSRD